MIRNSKLFVLKQQKIHTVPVYMQGDNLGLCLKFVKKQLGSTPKHIGVLVSNKRFLGSKRVFVHPLKSEWKWGTPNETALKGMYYSAIAKLMNAGIVEVESKYRPIYFRIRGLTNDGKSV